VTPDVPDNSAEIGNKKNQLENTQRGLSALESTRATLEKSDKSNSSQLQELEASLATARSRHEEESKIVADLRSRVSDQQEKMKNLNMDTIAAESDLSAMRSERDELEQALLRDKEEIRGLQKKMREADEEKTTLKNLLEKLKKETRQQKGMVTIAKKQLSTSEGNRDNAQKDLDDFHKNAQDEEEEEESRGRGLGGGASAGLGALGGAALGAGAASAFGQHQERSASPFGQAQSPVGHEGAAGIALPATPQALSPVATGASNRSNNPFDRLRTQSRGPAPPGPQAQSPPSASTPTFERSASPVTRDVEAPQEEPRSPGGTATGILAGAGTAVGLAAGVAVAGASAVFGAAKEAITGEHSDDEEKKDVSEKAVAEKDEDKTPTAEESDPFGAPSHSSPIAGGQETDVFGAVTGPTQSGFSESAASDSDPFGAPTSAEPVSKDLETDAFGASSPAQPDISAPPAAETDPFGASTQTSFDNFDNGFGDSFAAAPTAAAGVAPAPSGNADFDSAFDDFDDASAAPSESQVPETAGQMTASPERDAMSPGLPVGIPKSALTALQSGSGLERTDSTQAVAPASPKVMPATGETTPAEPAADRSVTDEPTEELLSSDEEDEGPEDLDAPKRGYNSTNQSQDDDDVPLASLKSAAVAAPALASPVDAPKGRRSAPPPPASKSSTGAAPVPIDDFDPFGAPSATAAAAAPPTTQPFDNDFGSLPPGAAPAQAQTTGPQTSKFDDDDFDFSDMPPARVDDSEPPATITKNTSAFDDEFAGFDDEFESVPTNPNSGSDRSNLSKSFEMVSPSQGQPQQAQQPTGNTDEWGQPAGQQLQRPAPPARGFSFDDAFGGDFEPA
jgi:epidermal growth factor receptor substrate 15